MEDETRVEKLAVESLNADPRAQPRAEINQFVVDEYAEVLRAGGYFPPVVVFMEEDVYWLADGFHRHAATVRAGRATIDAEVRPGGLRDAILHSVGANARHGQRRTNADKRRAVTTLLKDPEWSAWSDREIARQTSVSPTFVSSLRKTLSINDGQMRKVSRGKSSYPMDTTRIGASQKLTETTRGLIRDSDLVDDRKEIDWLSKLPPTTQEEVAGKISTGESKSVKQRLIDKRCWLVDYRTPPRILDPVRNYFRDLGGDGIELDPATAAANPTRAEVFYTPADDGLSKSWSLHPSRPTNIFCNPPYGEGIREWLGKIREAAEEGNNVVALLPANRFEQDYFQATILTRHLTAVCFIRGRVDFLFPDGEPGRSNPYASLLYFYNGAWEAVKKCFSDLGTCLRLDAASSRERRELALRRAGDSRLQIGHRERTGRL